MKEVATLCGIAVGKVYNRLKANGVQTRSNGDYPTSQKVIETARRTGLARKGRKQTEETKKKLSEAKFRGGIGHKKKRSDGYISVYMPEHPHASNDGYVMEHDLVMECAIGRWLSDDEVVHHKNKKQKR